MIGSKTILVIDDSMTQIRVLNMLLQDKYKVLSATSGYEGVTIAKKERPDLILLDYDMPIMSGKETFHKLQENEETKDIPVLFLTGVDEKEDIMRVLVLRPKGYLLKPVDQNRLFESIEKIFDEQQFPGFH